MEEQKARKTDRRTLYTRKLIKDSFINLLDSGITIDKIRVSEICRISEINRCTFYLHFADVYAVLEELQHEVKEAIENCVRVSLEGEAERESICTIMFASIRENHVYQVLNRHHLTSEILKYSFEYSKNLFVKLCVETNQFSPREAELFAIFLISGCAAVSEDQVVRHWDTFEQDNAFVNKILNCLYSLLDMHSINLKQQQHLMP